MAREQPPPRQPWQKRSRRPAQSCALSRTKFRKLLGYNAQGLVVHAVGGLFSPGHKYLMGYKGLAFYTSAREAILLPSTCQIVEAKKIWIPG